jgi:parallel beta-helix repeat protein
MKRQWWHGFRQPKRGRWRLEMASLTGIPYLLDLASFTLATVARWCITGMLRLKGLRWALIGAMALPTAALGILVGSRIGYGDGYSRFSADVLPWNVRDKGAKGDGVSDDFAAIQKALDEAGGIGGKVFVPDSPSPYIIKRALEVPSGVHLYLAPSATIKRGAAIDNMVRNKADGVTGGYTANQNITIEGGTWDGSRTDFASFTTVMAFGHTTNVRVRNCRVKSWYGWHAVELNACQNARVENCIFTDHGADAANDGEAVQLDIMGGAGQFPWFGPYDNTPCDNVMIFGCTFGPTLKRGVGTHFAVNNIRHTYVRIIGNHFTVISDAAIVPYNYAAPTIVANTVESCKYGVLFLTDAVTVARGGMVAGNTFRNLNVDSPNDRGIWVQGGGGTGFIRGGAITGNTFDTVSRYAISIDSTADWVVAGNNIQSSGTSGVPVGGGILLFQCSKCSVTGNSIYSSGDLGITLNGATLCVVKGNIVRESFRHGIQLGDSKDNVIHGNLLTENGQAANNTLDNIALIGDSDDNNIQGNTCRQGALANKPRYGINVSAATCNTNLVTNNDLKGGGVTGALNDAGTGTVVAAGNRLA